MKSWGKRGKHLHGLSPDAGVTGSSYVPTAIFQALPAQVTESRGLCLSLPKSFQRVLRSPRVFWHAFFVFCALFLRYCAMVLCTEEELWREREERVAGSSAHLFAHLRRGGRVFPAPRAGGAPPPSLSIPQNPSNLPSRTNKEG